jgi:hypothetical protein
MAFLKKHAVAFTTAADGSATVYTTGFVNGAILQVDYTYDDAATGADFTVTGRTTGEAILTITNAGTSSISWQPRQVIHPVANTGAGTALTYDGTNEIYGPIWIVDEEIKIVVASGGNAKSGTLTFIVG